MKRILVLLVLMGACSDNQPAAGPAPAPKPDPAATPAKPTPAPRKNPDIIQFEAPAGWKEEEPSNNMRKAQYRIPDKEKKASDAELALFYFGANSGMIEANIDRWAGQMGADGANPETIQGNLKITLVDLKGTYTGDASGEPMEHARMLAAVVETEKGPWYFKIVGPADTVGDWREEFVAMLKAAKE